MLAPLMETGRPLDESPLLLTNHRQRFHCRQVTKWTCHFVDIRHGMRLFVFSSIRSLCTYDFACMYRQTDNLTFWPGCSFIFPIAAAPGLVAIVTEATPPPPSWFSPPSEGQVVLTSAPSVERFPKRIFGSIAVCLVWRSVLFVCLVGWCYWWNSFLLESLILRQQMESQRFWGKKRGICNQVGYS